MLRLVGDLLLTTRWVFGVEMPKWAGRGQVWACWRGSGARVLKVREVVGQYSYHWVILTGF